MADYVPPGEVSLYQHMPELRGEIYEQRTQCCWAIAVAVAVGYTYRVYYGVEGFEVSVQDIFDRVWFYFSEEERLERAKTQDQRGGFRCSNSVAYDYVNKMGTALAKDYPFENRLNRTKGSVTNTEVPRVFCDRYERLDLDGAVNAIMKGVAVTAAVEVTDAFRNYGRQGIYRKATGDTSHGTHSVVIVGVNVEHRYFRIQNSWGTGWGYDGFGLIHFDSIERFTCSSFAWMEAYPRVN